MTTFQTEHWAIQLPPEWDGWELDDSCEIGPLGDARLGITTEHGEWPDMDEVEWVRFFAPVNSRRVTFGDFIGFERRHGSRSRRRSWELVAGDVALQVESFAESAVDADLAQAVLATLRVVEQPIGVDVSSGPGIVRRLPREGGTELRLIR